MSTDSIGQMDLFGNDPFSTGPRSCYRQEDSPLSSEVEVPKRLYLGTSSWSFPGWEGLVYQGKHTESELAKSGLRAYAEVPYLRTVSLDRTYYRTMKVAQYRDLAQQVGAGFRFVVKAPRDLLQPNRNIGASSALRNEFLDPLVEGLGDKLGVVLFQFPPGSCAEFGGEGPFLESLNRWLSSCPQGVLKCLEVRDASMVGASLKSLLEDHGTSFCASIHPQLPTIDKQLLQIPPPPSTPLVIRWNLRPSLSYETARSTFAPFRELKSPDLVRRTRLVAIVHRALEAGRTVFVTINNKAEGCSPLSVKALLEEYSSRTS